MTGKTEQEVRVVNIKDEDRKILYVDVGIMSQSEAQKVIEDVQKEAHDCLGKDLGFIEV